MRQLKIWKCELYFSSASLPCTQCPDAFESCNVRAQVGLVWCNIVGLVPSLLSTYVRSPFKKSRCRISSARRLIGPCSLRMGGRRIVLGISKGWSVMIQSAFNSAHEECKPRADAKRFDLRLHDTPLDSEASYSRHRHNYADLSSAAELVPLVPY